MPRELLTPEQIAQLEALALAATERPYHKPNFLTPEGWTTAATLDLENPDAPTIETEAKKKAHAQILDCVLEIMAPYKTATRATVFRSSEHDSASGREHWTRKEIAEALRQGVARAIPRPSSPFSIGVRDVSEAIAHVKRWEYPTDKAAQTVGQWIASLDPWAYAHACAKVCYLADHDPESAAALVRALAHAIALERAQSIARAQIASIFNNDERARDDFRIGDELTPQPHDRKHPLSVVRDAITRQGASDLLLIASSSDARLILETLKTHAPKLLECRAACQIRNELEKAREEIAKRLTQRHETPTQSALRIVFESYEATRDALKGERESLKNSPTWLQFRKEQLKAQTLDDIEKLAAAHAMRGSAQAAHHLITQQEQGLKPSTWQEIGQVFAADPGNAHSRSSVIEATKSRLAAFGLHIEKRAFVWNP